MCVRRAAETASMCSVSCASSVDGHRAWRLELPICRAHTKPVAKSVSNSNPWGARQPAMIRKPTASARPATLAPAHRTAGTRRQLNEDRQHADHALGGSGVWTSPRRVTSCTVTSRRCSRHQSCERSKDETIAFSGRFELVHPFSPCRAFENRAGCRKPLRRAYSPAELNTRRRHNFTEAGRERAGLFLRGDRDRRHGQAGALAQ